ncbi:MAG: glycosyltransferase family 2 protein [Chloroflexi bacterium]|nr:glycosyltransferase family 2 protein [Chloroflexota bacterium]
MKFSVVIPTYNRQNTLRQTLAALVAQDYADYESIVVDDGSNDGTRAMIAQEFPRARYLYQQNRGPAAARNRGIASASGEIVAFTDDDCLPPRDWLTRLADGYARYPQIAGVGGGLIAPAELLATNIFARYERYIGSVVYHVGEQESLGGFECPAGGTANMSYRRAVLEQMHGFDERFPVPAGEDADLKMHICRRGHRLLYVPTWMIHLQEYSWQRFRRQCYVRGVGRNYFESKNGRGYPSRLKIALRAARRLADLPLDLARMSDRRLAFIKLADGLITCHGQWVGK